MNMHRTLLPHRFHKWCGLITADHATETSFGIDVSRDGPPP